MQCLHLGTCSNLMTIYNNNNNNSHNDYKKYYSVSHFELCINNHLVRSFLDTQIHTSFSVFLCVCFFVLCRSIVLWLVQMCWCWSGGMFTLKLVCSFSPIQVCLHTCFGALLALYYRHCDQPITVWSGCITILCNTSLVSLNKENCTNVYAKYLLNDKSYRQN